MKQPPKPLLQDPSLGAELQAELAQFHQDCAQHPYDLQSGLARFEAQVAATASTAAASTTAGVTAAGKSAGLGVVAKTLLAGVGLSLGGAAVLWAVQQSPEPKSSSAKAPIVVSQESPLPSPAVQEEAEKPAPSPETTGSGSVAAELALLKRARTALNRKQAQRALRILQEGESRFPKGTLLQERQALQVIAAFEAGQKSRARKAARAFLKRHPQSPMAARIRQLLAKSSR